MALPSKEWDSHLARVRAQSKKVTEPLWWRATRYNNSLQPVVGITFFEAAAFCRWLSDVSVRTYTLLGELEWESAARGIGRHPRIYAFGDELRADACNIREPHEFVGAPRAAAETTPTIVTTTSAVVCAAST
ncbi:MAG: formylglycine-generating enzyme family protein [Methylococcaceae bacterium]|nr:formylglycine-generating enzyme family protein [Methylococcaceae bacterium]